MVQFERFMDREERLESPVEERCFSAASSSDRMWASAPVAPLGLKAVADSLENAALKGRSSTVKKCPSSRGAWRFI